MCIRLADVDYSNYIDNKPIILVLLNGLITFTLFSGGKMVSAPKQIGIQTELKNELCLSTEVPLYTVNMNIRY